MSALSEKKRSQRKQVVSYLIAITALIFFVLYALLERKPKESNSLANIPGSPAATEEPPAGEPLGQSSIIAAQPNNPLPLFPNNSTPSSGSIPADLPEDLVRSLNAPPPDLPDDLKAQLNAPPPELPEDLKRQLMNPVRELPPDLKAQLESPPPELPEDIKQALKTPPRVVTIEEVNTTQDPGL